MAFLKFFIIDGLRVANTFLNFHITYKYGSIDDDEYHENWTFVAMSIALLTPFVVWWHQGLKARLLRRHRILQNNTQINYVEALATNQEDEK